MKQKDAPGVGKMKTAMDEGKRQAGEAREELLSAACALCHYPYIAESQDAMEEICESCPIVPLLDKCLLLERTNTTARILRLVAEELLPGEGDTSHAGSALV